MPYTPTNWVDGTTLVDATRMNKVETGLVNAEEKALKGAANGYAPLDASALVPAVNLPPIASVPTGSILMFGGGTAPTGFLLCDGTSYPTATYPALFAAIGYLYGGSGANFNVPNLKGRSPVGRDPAQTEFDTRGKTGGTKTQTLAVGDLPSHDHGGGVHTHSISDPGHNHGVSDPSHAHSVSDPTHSHSTGTESADHVHQLTNMAYSDTDGGYGSFARFQTTGSGGILTYKFNSTTGRSAAHSHGVNGAATGIGIYGAYTGVTVNAGTTGIGVSNSAAVVTAQGGGGAHNNLAPYLVVEHIIKT